MLAHQFIVVRRFFPPLVQVLPAPGSGEDDSATWESTWQSVSKRSLLGGQGFEFDVKIHCVANEPDDPDEPPSPSPNDGEEDPADMPSLSDPSTRKTYTIELTLAHDDPDERALWRNYPNEISGATEWLRRKIRRKLKQGVGRRFPVPAVEVGLPGKLEFPAQADGMSLTDHDDALDGGGVGRDEPPSPEESNEVLEGRPVKSVSVPTPVTSPDLVKDDHEEGSGTLNSLMKSSPLPHEVDGSGGVDRGAPSPAKSAGGRPGLLKKSSYTNRVQSPARDGDHDKGGKKRDGSSRRKSKSKVVPPATIDIPSPAASYGSEHSELGESLSRPPPPPASVVRVERRRGSGTRLGYDVGAEDIAASPPRGRGDGSEERRLDRRGSTGAVVGAAPLKQSDPVAQDATLRRSDRARSESQERGRKPSSSFNSGHSSGGSRQGSRGGSLSRRHETQRRMGLMSQLTGEA